LSLCNSQRCTRSLVLTAGRNAASGGAGQLVSAVDGNGTNYVTSASGYDAWGNLLQKGVTKCGAEGLTVTGDGHNWIHASGTDYQYDAAGNMTFNATAPTQNYTYDQENRLTGAAGYAYTYDADGNRAIKSNGSTGTLYWYMMPGVVAESDLAGTTKSEYIFFDGERVARLDGPTGADGLFYYFSDHLKTASVTTDASGNIKSESDYYPWGGELQFVANDSNHYKFIGKERDSESCLDYFGARYYSNGLGRFITPDWAAKATAVPYAVLGDPQTLNLYSYVRNIPTSQIDADWPFSTLRDVPAPVQPASPPAPAPPPATAPPTVGPPPISVGTILTGAAILYALYASSPFIETVGQSDEEERAQIEQSKHEREEQNGGVDPQEPQTSTGGAHEGSGGSGKSGKGTQNRGKEFSQQGTIDPLRSIQQDQRIKNIESTKKSEQNVDNANKKIKSSEDLGHED
jgi:RHS repeat-associated protein